MTAHPDIGSDVHQIFQQVSGLAPAIKLKRLLQAPFTLHAGIIDKIGREAKTARAGRGGHIIAKMNALTEPMVIRALYKASQAGVKIELIVRGACALRPGVAGIRSEAHKSEIQSLMRISYAVFCLQKTNSQTTSKLNNS